MLALASFTPCISPLSGAVRRTRTKTCWRSSPWTLCSLLTTFQAEPPVQGPSFNLYFWVSESSESLLGPWEDKGSVKEKESENHSVMSDYLGPHGLYSPWNSPGQNTGVGSLSLLQGIFPTQGLNPGLPHCRQILYQLSRGGRGQ